MHYATNGTNVNLPEKIFKIIEQCLQVYPSKRPNSAELLELLIDFSTNLKICNYFEESIEDMTSN